MRMPTSSRFAAITLVVAAGCSLPSRDNPNDPDNAPVADLRVIGISRNAAACPAPDPDTWPEVLSGSRGMCLGLDASGTTDPTDEASALSYEFRFVQPCDGGTGAILSTGSVAVIPSEALLGCTLGEPLAFGVKVADPDGGRSATETRIVLENARPVARTNPPRTLPAGGFAWNPGGEFRVAFSASGSHDPDGDRMLYEFTFGDGSVVRDTNPDSPSFIRTVPPTPGITTATLRVYDGEPGHPSTLASSVVTAVVYVREPNLWTVSETVNRLYRLDGIRHAFDAPLESVYDVRLLPSTQSTTQRLAVAYSDGFTNRVGVVTVPGYAVQNVIDVGGDFHSISVDAAAGELWVVNFAALSSEPGCPNSAGDFTMRQFDVTTWSQTGCQILAFQETPVGDKGPLTAIDDAGRMWMGQFLFGNRLAVVDGAGQLFEGILEPDRRLTAVESRPSTDETWALWMPDFLVGSTSGSATFARYTAPEAPPELIETSAFFAFGLAWIDPDRFWTFDPYRGLLLVDASLLDAGAPFESSIIRIVPDVFEGFVVMAEPDSGTAWATDFEGLVTSRVTIDGDVTEFTTSGISLEQVDRTGALWFTEDQALSRALVPAGDGVVTSHPAFTFDQGASADPTTGGIWVSTPLSGLLTLVAEDGRVVRSISTIVLDGEERPLPFLLHVSVAPHGSAIYGVEVDAIGENTGSILRIDTSTHPPSASRVVDAATADTVYDLGGNVDAGPARTGQAPVLWMVTGPQPAVLVMATNGTGRITRLTVPASEYADPFQDHVLGAPAWDVDRYCLAVLDATDGQIHLRSVPATGTVPAATTIASVTPPVLDAAATSPGTCWAAFSYNDPTLGDVVEIVGISNNGTIIRRHVEPGFDASLLPMSADEVWLTLSRTGAAGETHHVLRLTGYGVTGYQIRDERALPARSDFRQGNIADVDY